MDILQMLVTVACSLAASSGFWAFAQRRIDRRRADTKILVGLARDRIVSLGMEYIRRGWISAEEYGELYDGLYVPYRESGGNGSAERVMNEVAGLPPEPPDAEN